MNFLDKSSCGMYRTQDPIENLKIRVRLEKHAASGVAPTSREPTSIRDEMELKDISNRSSSRKASSAEERVFSWQEKVLSSSQMQARGESEQQDVPESSRSQELNFRQLFSYVNHEEVIKSLPATDSPNEKLTPEKETGNIRRRVGSKVARERDIQKLFHSNLVNYRPTKAQRETWHSVNTPLEFMHIMADIGTRTSNGCYMEKEIVLCTIQVGAQGSITVTPDFNGCGEAYRIETGDLGRDLYSYTIENISPGISKEEKEQETKLYSEIYSRHASLLTSKVGHEFSMPPSGLLKIFVSGEIVSAEGFEYDLLYVNYVMDVPQNWNIDSEVQSYGSTQLCYTKCVGLKDVAYFCFPFSYQLVCKLEDLLNCEPGNGPRWPQFCMQVMSKDSWNRFRTEGYGHVTLTANPGERVHHVETWRPSTVSLTNQMKRFFIGGSPELDDLTLAGAVPTVQGNRLSKYGMTTESSGVVTIRLNVVSQCQDFLTSKHVNEMDSLSQRLGASGLHTSVAAVLEAFQRARRRMLAARENLQL